MKRIIVIGLAFVLVLIPILSMNCDNGDNNGGSTGSESTDTTAPVISGITVSNITETTVTISWTTDEAATSNIEYGTTSSYGSSFPSLADTTADKTSHSLNLSGLSSGTTYHFCVKSEDATNNEVISGEKIFTTISLAMPTGELTVHFIDVGQGDAILIDLNDVEILIDGGGTSPGVTGYLETYVDGNLEVMVATHMHADHIGGLIAVLNTFDVDEIWHNGDTSTSQTYTNFMSAVNSEEAQVNVASRGEQISVDD